MSLSVVYYLRDLHLGKNNWIPFLYSGSFRGGEILNLNTIVEDKLADFFNIFNGLPHYIGIEEKEHSEFNNDKLSLSLKGLIQEGKEIGIKRISALINRKSNHYLKISNMLASLGFEPFALKIEVYRDLLDIIHKPSEYKWRSLEDYTFSEDEFKIYWHQCMSGSDNTHSSRKIDEHLDSVKSELGENWRSSCKVIYLKDEPIGISIPHIEPGTKNEGRLFYFGVLPEQRGKGHSSIIHYQSLFLLKQLGATYYIGSTHEKNRKMQKTFLRNGCSIKAATESYYYYFNKE